MLMRNVLVIVLSVSGLLLIWCGCLMLAFNYEDTVKKNIQLEQEYNKLEIQLENCIQTQ